MESSINTKELQKMIFVYNAIMDGWTVRKLKNNRLEFKKKKDTEIREIKEVMESLGIEFNETNCLNHFIKNNISRIKFNTPLRFNRFGRCSMIKPIWLYIKNTA